MGPEASSDDSLAVFEDALFTLFDQPVIAHSAPPGAARYTFRHPALGGRQVELALPSPPPGLNSLQAQYVWPSSLLLADLLLRGGGEIVLRPGETVVELGAGAGLGGLLAAVCLERAGGGGTVVSTAWGDTATFRLSRKTTGAISPLNAAIPRKCAGRSSATSGARTSSQSLPGSTHHRRRPQ
jgi:hypothetical protein